MFEKEALELEAEEKAKKRTKGRHWYNNGFITISVFVCPEGFVKGRLNGGRK